jgi:hypothetical protein
MAETGGGGEFLGVSHEGPGVEGTSDQLTDPSTRLH